MIEVALSGVVGIFTSAMQRIVIGSFFPPFCYRELLSLRNGSTTELNLVAEIARST